MLKISLKRHLTLPLTCYYQQCSHCEVFTSPNSISKFSIVQVQFTFRRTKDSKELGRNFYRLYEWSTFFKISSISILWGKPIIEKNYCVKRKMEKFVDNQIIAVRTLKCLMSWRHLSERTNVPIPFNCFWMRPPHVAVLWIISLVCYILLI